jgi:hypothetical protein
VPPKKKKIKLRHCQKIKELTAVALKRFLSFKEASAIPHPWCLEQPLPSVQEEKSKV